MFLKNILNQKYFSIPLFLLQLAACASTGVRVDPAKINDFTVGKSTCEDVKAALGHPTQRSSAVGGKSGKDIIIWKYTYSAFQAHPENFIPIVNAFASGADVESSVVVFVFYKDGCVLAGTRYAESDMGTGGNLEGVTQGRKDTRTAE